MHPSNFLWSGLHISAARSATALDCRYLCPNYLPLRKDATSFSSVWAREGKLEFPCHVSFPEHWGVREVLFISLSSTVSSRPAPQSMGGRKVLPFPSLPHIRLLLLPRLFAASRLFFIYSHRCSPEHGEKGDKFFTPNLPHFFPSQLPKVPTRAHAEEQK